MTIVKQEIFVFVIYILTKTIFAQCPGSFYSLSMFAPGIPGCVYFSQDKTQLVSWGVGQRMCKQMDPRSNLPFFADTKQMSQFQGMSGPIKSQSGPIGSSLCYTTIYRIGMLAMQVGKTTVWLGGYRRRSDDAWLFVDGTPMMTNTTGGWQKGTPNTTTTETLRCLGYSIGGTDTGWRDFPCSSNFSIGCYISDPTQKLNVTNVNPIASAASNSSPACTGDWTTGGSYCYKLAAAGDTIMNFTSAVSACKRFDSRANLPQFSYSSDWDAFIKFVELHRPNSDHQYILLGGKKLNNVYANSDATWTFSNWYAFQPAGEECIFASDIMGYGWNTTSCSTNGYAICQLNTSLPFEATTGASTISTTSATTTTTTNFTGTTTYFTGSTFSTLSQSTVTSTNGSANISSSATTPQTTTSATTPSNVIQSQGTTSAPKPAIDTTPLQPVTAPASIKGSTSVIVPYSWTWSPPMWFLIILGLLVVIPVIFWIVAIVYRECRDRKDKPQPQPHPQVVQSQQPVVVEPPPHQGIFGHQRPMYVETQVTSVYR